MILIKNLNKSFKSRMLFENLNLELPSNKLVFIVGKSGVGKSTLLKLISGYEKQDSGTIDFVNYQNLDFKNIDFVFQDFNLIKGLSVLENLQVGVNVLGIEFDKQKALEILKKLDISFELSKQKIESLSGGEQQRVAIARSILRNSKILLTDEPTGNLDFENSEIIFEYLKEISKTKTVIIVTHDIENAKKYGDYIVEMEENNISQYYLGNSSSKEQKFYNNEVQMLISKTKPKFKLIPKFTRNDVKRRIIQLFFLIFAFVATVVSFGSFVQLRNGIETKATQISTSYLQTDKILVIKPILGSLSTSTSDFFSKEIDLFKNLPDLKYWTKTYQYGGARISYNSNITNFAIDFEFIDFNDFYKNRMIDNISIGSFPTNDNEIIISKTLVQGLNIEDPIGKTILYHDQTGDLNIIEELKIVAVNEATDFTGRNFTFISNNLIKKIAQANISKITSFSLAIPVQTITNNSENFIRLFNDIYQGKWSILEDLEPTLVSNNNINVNDDLPSVYISKKIVDANKLKINDKIFVAIGPKETALRLAGIINTEEDIVALTRSFEKEFTTPSPNQISLYFNDNVNTATLVRELRDKPEYNNFTLSSNRSNFAAAFSMNISYTVNVLGIVAGSLFLISTLFVIGFTKIFNDFKKREIGLLKSLGSSLKQILIYHFSYYLLINILVLIISLILVVPISQLVISFFDNSNNIGFDYSTGFSSLFLIWSVNLAVTALIFMVFSYFKFRKNISYLLK